MPVGQKINHKRCASANSDWQSAVMYHDENLSNLKLCKSHKGTSPISSQITLWNHTTDPALENITCKQANEIYNMQTSVIILKSLLIRKCLLSTTFHPWATWSPTGIFWLSILGMFEWFGFQ